ncbi:MAG: MCE family protein [Rhodospirillaceae bacterium]|jgi:phospholipid/cholesterol/gamma-HCH transport system substrate-binding protein|nr:MCE family protein [Rhodospirillaceae bacterium]MBT4940566.1 MCE family protein [Rhodospirillaceae bacterium]MBT5939955.1 MCE family protein [Rhodospirillaceae bacterium]MBT7265624.1 MCE family protein [Rhodospirillaceae bacterium]
MKEEVRHIFIGLTTLVVLMLVAGLSFSSSNMDAPRGVFVKAVFNQIDGLSVGDDVRMGGVVVGKVSTLDLGDHYTAVVMMRIDNPIKVPNDTSAAIHTDGLFGRKYITLEPGGDEEYLGTGDEITMTQDSVVVQDLLELIIGEAKAKRAKK